MTQHDKIDISVSCVTVTCVILRLLSEKITTNSSLKYIDIDDMEYLISSLNKTKYFCCDSVMKYALREGLERAKRKLRKSSERGKRELRER